MQPTQLYDGILTALTEQDEELDGLVSGLDDDGWSRVTPRCPEWTMSYVVLHAAQTDEAAPASAVGRLYAADIFRNRVARSPDMTSDDLAGMAVTAQRGPSGKEIYERWRAASAAQL
ncbi:MAG: maleylpyruvate isomerase N-terminal domain-containing protein, partial [Actinobacteria bacterium]|nr:maleylpyruvate isomerase N-terminal domain-containing protein [Actinomycetota bacterium]